MDTEVIRTLHTEQPIYSLLSPFPGTLVIGGSAASLETWDVETCQRSHIMSREHLRLINCLVKAQEQTFLSGSEDATIRLWDLRMKQSIGSFVGHDGPVRALYWRDQTIYSGSEDASIGIWDIRSRSQIELLPTKDPVNSILIYKSCLLSAGRSLTLWRLSGPHKVRFHTSSLTTLFVLPDLDFLVTASRDTTLAVWKPINL